MATKSSEKAKFGYYMNISYGLHFGVFILSGCITGYCFLRVVFPKLVTIFVNEEEIFSNIDKNDGLKLLVFAKILPHPHFDKKERQAFESAWWKYAIVGGISFLVNICVISIQG